MNEPKRFQFSLKHVLLVILIAALTVCIALSFGWYGLLQVVDFVVVGLIFHLFCANTASVSFRVTASGFYSLTLYLLLLVHFFDSGIATAIPVFAVIGIAAFPALVIFGGVPPAVASVISLVLFAYRIILSLVFTYSDGNETLFL